MKSASRVLEVVTGAGKVLLSYLGGQLLIVLILAGVYAFSFYWFQVPLWFLLAPVCGFLHILPVLGVVLGAAIPLLVAVIAGTNWSQVAGILGAFAAANVLETFVLIPLIHGRRLRLHPLAVLLAVLAGGAIFGFFGALLAVPALAVAVVVWRLVARDSAA